jgi:hypothetical protein
MDLLHYFVGSDFGGTEFGKGALAEQVSQFSSQESIAGAGLAVACIGKPKDHAFLMQVCKKLYGFYPHFSFYLCDMGMLSYSENIADRYKAIEFFLEQLYSMGKPAAVLCTDSFSLLADVYADKYPSKEVSFIQNSWSAEPALKAAGEYYTNRDTNIIGTQNFLCGPVKLNSRCLQLRYGQLIDNINLAEPMLRDSSAVFLDTAAAAASSLYAGNTGSANGLSSHGLCQLSYLSGRSSVPQLFAAGCYVSQIDPVNMYNADLAAQLVWHYALGLSHKIEFSADPKETYKKYYTESMHESIDICHIQDTAKNIWWAEISIGAQTSVIASNEVEYKSMVNGDIPERILRKISSFGENNSI